MFVVDLIWGLAATTAINIKTKINCKVVCVMVTSLLLFFYYLPNTTKAFPTNPATPMMPKSTKTEMEIIRSISSSKSGAIVELPS